MTDSQLLAELNNRFSGLTGVGRKRVFETIDDIWAHPEIAPVLQAIRKLHQIDDLMKTVRAMDARVSVRLAAITKQLERIEANERFTAVLAPIGRNYVVRKKTKAKKR